MYSYEITYVAQMNFCNIGSVDAATIVRNVTSQAQYRKILKESSMKNRAEK